MLQLPTPGSADTGCAFVWYSRAFVWRCGFFFSLRNYAAKFKEINAVIKQPWRKAPNCVTLFNQSQRLIQAHPPCGFTRRINRADPCSAGGWLSWSSLQDARGSCSSSSRRAPSAGCSCSHRRRAAGQPPLSFLTKMSAARHSLLNNNQLIIQI